MDDPPWLLAVNFVNPHDVRYFAAGEAWIASRRDRAHLAPLAPAPVDPLYARRWSELPANCAGDLVYKPLAQRHHATFCDMAHRRIPEGEEACRAGQGEYLKYDLRRRSPQVLSAAPTAIWGRCSTP